MQAPNLSKLHQTNNRIFKQHNRYDSLAGQGQTRTSGQIACDYHNHQRSKCKWDQPSFGLYNTEEHNTQPAWFNSLPYKSSHLPTSSHDTRKSKQYIAMDHQCNRKKYKASQEQTTCTNLVQHHQIAFCINILWQDLKIAVPSSFPCCGLSSQ